MHDKNTKKIKNKDIWIFLVYLYGHRFELFFKILYLIFWNWLWRTALGRGLPIMTLLGHFWRPQRIRAPSCSGLEYDIWRLIYSAALVSSVVISFNEKKKLEALNKRPVNALDTWNVTLLGYPTILPTPPSCCCICFSKRVSM